MYIVKVVGQRLQNLTFKNNNMYTIWHFESDERYRRKLAP
jgi:hypothetical protein